MLAAPQRSVNYWPQSACARAFWGQQELPPYKRLLADTADWLDPQAGQRWLDLGCGCGKLTEVLWHKSAGRIGKIVGLDVAADNDRAYDRLRRDLGASPAQIQFVCGDFSSGLAAWEDASCDGVVSGLALQYAESYSEERGCWTTEAYEHLLREVYRVLRPGCPLVFSVNVPNPPWHKLALSSLGGALVARRPAHYLKKALRMWRYGFWLNREARRGRFHYLPINAVWARLTQAGFVSIEHRLSYDGLAYLVRCWKPTVDRT